MCPEEHTRLPAVAPAVLDLLERIRVLEKRVASLELRQMKPPKRVKRKRDTTYYGRSRLVLEWWRRPKE